MMIIYVAFNFQSGRAYIGQTTGSLRDRIQGHKDAAKSKKGHHTVFRNAIRKYGIEAFRFTILRTCESQEELDLWECVYIALFGGYNDRSLTYNVKDGGYNGKPSENVRRLISESKRGRNTGPDNHFYGKSHTNESRELMSKRRKGMLSGPDHYMYGKPRFTEKNRYFCSNLSKWRESEEGKIALSVKNSGFGNPHAVKFTDEQRMFILDLKLKQNLSYRRVIKIFSEKYFKISDSPIKTVCKYA